MALRIGDRVPELELVTDAGDLWSLTGFAGRNVVVILHRHFY